MKVSTEKMNEIAGGIYGIDVEVVVCEGIPAKVMAEKTKELNVDLVVMPTHGRKGFKHLVLGSFAERMVRIAHCPVLTIHPSSGH